MFDVRLLSAPREGSIDASIVLTDPACAAARGADRCAASSAAGAAAQADPEKPVTPPDSYRVVMENDRVRMIEIHIKPHSKVNVEFAGGARALPLHAVRRRADPGAARQDALRVRAACRRDRGVSGGFSDGRERHRFGRARPDGRDQGSRCAVARRPARARRTRFAKGKSRGKVAAKSGARQVERRECQVEIEAEASRQAAQAAGRAATQPAANAPLNLRKANAKPAEKVTGKGGAAS